MMRMLFINREKCNGCGLCQALCSIKHKGACQPAQGLIRVKQDSRRLLTFCVTCLHCSEPACQTACLMECISKDPDTGRVVRNLTKCIGCGACLVACPNDAPVIDEEREVLMTCDYCDGDPVCLKVCPRQAISWEEPSGFSEKKRQIRAARYRPFGTEEALQNA